MWMGLAQAADGWASLYSDSAVIRTAVGFVHIAGLLTGGGAAIVEDRSVLGASMPDERVRRQRASAVRATHRVVLSGLALLIASGLLLFAADYEVFGRSRVFWLKMGMIGLLLVNGAMLTRAARAVEGGDPAAWRRLRLASVRSLTLWLLIALLGAALPNV